MYDITFFGKVHGKFVQHSTISPVDYDKIAKCTVRATQTEIVNVF